MSKAYSNKALPPGTILREWRLESVLGVGGFGIVYKGRGIYFDELVAIKEYFPSSISERDEDATVVPIDSDAEEVHALGLKKFVEEAKLLWNLSTPTRHPNIVSVRSLFEIHGTAYMVMDFEDGMSLSKMIKTGHKFTEAELGGLIRPIAEGLERAHRVGVLHRDIKPPNILVNESGRSVLIDFGSARFESGEATSTKVTFHTPPYAAIEQYVKTYDQGPWTDIYALGVVLYECISGEKPPEVLERMHAGLGKPLAEGDWPGFSKPFLAAVDAAMTIKPGERPQSISQWLALFDQADVPIAPISPEPEDDEATRIADFKTSADEFVPVAPLPPGVEKLEKVETPVPNDPKEAEFKRVGEDTSASRKKASVSEAVAAAAATAKPAKAEKPAKPAGAPGAKKPNTLLIGGAAAALILAAGGGWYVMKGSGNKPDEALLTETGPAAVAPVPVVEKVDIAEAGGVAGAVTDLVTDAQKFGAPASAIKALTDAGPALAKLEAEKKGAGSDAAAAKAKDAEILKLASGASGQFAAALVSEADGRARKLARDLPWANPRNAGAAAGKSAEQQGVARSIRLALSGMRSAAASAGKAPDVAQSLTFARQALAQRSSYNTLVARAYRVKDSAAAAAGTTAVSGDSGAGAGPANTPSQASQGNSQAEAPRAGSGESATDSQKRSLKSVVDSAKEISKQVIRLADRDKDKDGAGTRSANAGTARNYENYLDTLSNSMRGKRSKEEAEKLIAQANQTRAYLNQLLAQSKASLK
ncbi:MAG: serine/threonine-protein kinase [Candidatus Andeanibacterium colombiense]|uniref:Serine/threonine-protein kinase n=1 Tax=Candidatus Andeanibacterium colombiense TaxID=3121345 RepID=A0AAJ6BN03_9SPHN|nr:MAG: serine/threonine-protein kinase [Sphingomonadaceae bacterium]